MAKKDGRIRKDVENSLEVQIVLKQDQKSGHLTKGIVNEILTGSARHPHGIKVRLKNGKIGRVQKILSSKKTPHGSTQTTTKESPTRNNARNPFKFLDY